MDIPSVNECLEKGSNLVVLLFDAIIKLRSYPLRIVSDIEKAFHQVQISPFGRCMLRFLWFDDVKKGNPIIKNPILTTHIWLDTESRSLVYRH